MKTAVEVVEECQTKGEPVFVLRAQDKFAPVLVELWAELVREGPKYNDAWQHAKTMRHWQKANGCKLPD